MRRVLVVVVALVAAACSSSGGSTTDAAPSPGTTATGYTAPDVCLASKAIRQFNRRTSDAWETALAASRKAKTLRKYHVAFQEAAESFTDIRADLQAVSVPANADLRQAKALVLQAVALMLKDAQRLSVIPGGSSVSDPYLADANALRTDSVEHLDATHC